MPINPQPPRIHLPKSWQDCVRSAVIHAIALAHYAIVYARAWAADSINARVRLAAVIDHHSRRVMGIETFRNNPTAVSVSRFLECAFHTASATPKYIICDKGQQFWCSLFKD